MPLLHVEVQMNTIDKIAFMATVLLSRHINIGTEQVKEAVACAADILASSAKLVLQKTHPMVDPAQSVDRVLDMSIMEFFSKESLMAVGATNYTATRVLSVIIGAMKKKEDPDYSAARKVSMRSFLEEMKNVSRIRGMGRKSIEAMFALLKKHDLPCSTIKIE